MVYLIFGKSCVFVFIEFFRKNYFYILKKIGGYYYLKCLCIFIILFYFSGSGGIVFECSMIIIINWGLKI